MEGAEVVVEIDCVHRLNPEGCAGAGLVVDDAFDASFKVGAEGDDVAAASLRNNRVLQILVGGGVDEAVEFFLDSAVENAHLLTDFGEVWAG